MASLHSFDMYSYLNSRWMTFRINGRNTGAYSFQNSFFYLQFPDDPIVYSHENSVNPALRAALITQRKTKRFVYIAQIPFPKSNTNFFSFVNAIDAPNCIRKSSDRNTFANRMQWLRQVIILSGNL